MPNEDMFLTKLLELAVERIVELEHEVQDLKFELSMVPYRQEIEKRSHDD